jgi:hypothetical protein
VTDPDWPELAPCEEIVPNSAELQWRQVKPQYINTDGADTLITDLAFQDDSHRVSTSRARLTNAESAYRFHVEAGLRSAGTWAVTAEEIDAASCRCIDDHVCQWNDTPGHSYIDMRGLHGKAARRVARVELATRATARGCQFAAPVESED